MRDSALNRLAADIVMYSQIVNYPPGKAGAIQKMNFNREQLKQLKSKHFQHPKK